MMTDDLQIVPRISVAEAGKASKAPAPPPRRSARPLKKHRSQADEFLLVRKSIEELQQQAAAINTIIAEKERVSGTLAGDLMNYAEEYEDRAFQTERILVALQDIPSHKAKVPQWKVVINHLLGKLESVSTDMRKEAEAFIEGSKREIPGETELLYKELENEGITVPMGRAWAMFKKLLDKVKQMGSKARSKLSNLEAEVDAFVDATKATPA